MPYINQKLVLGLLVGSIAASGAMWATEAPAPPKVSTFAPAPDLAQQAKYYAERIQEALGKEEGYSESMQTRVQNDANTLAVIALALSLHDTEGAMPQAAAMIGPAQKLSKSSKDYAAAKSAANDLEAAMEESGSAISKPDGWTKVASLGRIMEQSEQIYSTLKRGMDPRRFERNMEANAGMSATLAAIGQATILDTHEVKNPDDLGKWYAFGAEMRDSAAELNKAVYAKDASAAAAAMTRLGASCDACHEVFQQ